jgi:hypothetical protein
MTRNATLSDPFSSAFIRGQVALLEKNKKVKISKQSEPNIGKLPGSPSDLNLNRKSIFAIRTQEVIQNNTKRSLRYPGNPGNQGDGARNRCNNLHSRNTCCQNNTMANILC